VKNRLETHPEAEVACKPLLSSLSAWMCEHHAHLERIMRDKHPNWDYLAQRFATVKLCDHTGKPPTANTARITWKIVRQVVKQAKASKKRHHRADRLAG
jgi:hypothetical protein